MKALTLASCLMCCVTMHAHGEPPRLQISTFEAEVTPPIGHPCMGGGIAPVAKIEDPLWAKGFLLLGDGPQPIVVVAVDWCEIRNDAYERWREALADAVGTTPQRVLVCALHQHDAPIADLTAQKILNEHKAKGAICDLDFHEKAVQRVAAAAKDALKKARPITHFGIGQAKVVEVASNRRFFDKDGKLRFSRTSASRDAMARAAEVGNIDPWLKTLSFWDGDTPIVALSCYATHPMSYYGRGGVTADFVGLARQRRQTDLPKVFHIYASGCSGNVTAGKYNDGAPENRPILGDRIYQAMKSAWETTKKQPITKVTLRQADLKLEVRESAGFRPEELEKKLKEPKRPFDQCLAAFALSWRQRLKTKPAIDVLALDLGPAALLLLPAEAYVEYQQMAQKTRPDDFIVTLGYGECAPGYIPHEQAWKEGDGNLGDWSWIAPASEARMRAAIEKALAK